MNGLLSNVRSIGSQSFQTSASGRPLTMSITLTCDGHECCSDSFWVCLDFIYFSERRGYMITRKLTQWTPWFVAFRAMKAHQYALICLDFIWVLFTSNVVQSVSTLPLVGNTHRYKQHRVGSKISRMRKPQSRFINMDSKNHIDRILLLRNS